MKSHRSQRPESLLQLFKELQLFRICRVFRLWHACTRSTVHRYIYTCEKLPYWLVKSGSCTEKILAQCKKNFLIARGKILTFRIFIIVFSNIFNFLCAMLFQLLIFTFSYSVCKYSYKLNKYGTWIVRD